MEKIAFKDMTDIEKELYKEAKKVRKKAYAPYSKFKVGAALITTTNKIFSGCNVESVDLTLTTHAEMNAIDTMVANGETRLKELVVVLSSDDGLPMPCGLCRQKILEFCVKGTTIIGVNVDKNGKPKEIYKTTLEELMPYAFSSKNLT